MILRRTRTKLPKGDWIWPAIWMLPKNLPYGKWPASGEIDIMESRGNVNLKHNGHDIGVECYGATLHWGPFWPFNGYEKTTQVRDQANNLYGINYVFDQYRKYRFVILKLCSNQLGTKAKTS